MSKDEPIPQAFLDAFSGDSPLDFRINSGLSYEPDTLDKSYRFLTRFFTGMTESEIANFLRFLEDNSRPFLTLARNGIRELEGDHQPFDIEPLALAAANQTRIILASMPDLPLVVPSRFYISEDFLRRTHFPRPTDTEERLGRIDEIVGQLDGILSGEIRRGTIPYDNPPLIRTIGFFQAGSIIPGSI